MKRQLLSVLLSLLTTGLAMGDKIILHDGTEIEGKVLSEQGDSYEVEVQVSATIKDHKKIKKADVKAILRTSPEDIAFKLIEGLVPTPDRLSASDYDNRINKQVKAFTDAFPTANKQNQKRVAEILAILERERERAKAGGLKLDGKWIKPEEREANAYEIDARILFEDISAASDKSKYKVALRTFEEFERDFSATEIYQKAVMKTKEILLSYRPVIASGVKRADNLVAQRNGELERLPTNQRTAALSDIKRRSELYAKVLKQEKSRRTKWLTVEQYHKAPMVEVLNAIQSELKRLDDIDFEEIKLAGPVYREAWGAATAGDETTAQKHIGTLQGMRVPERYIESLKTRLAKQLEVATAVPATSDTATDDASTTDTPGEDQANDTATGEDPETTPTVTDDDDSTTEPPVVADDVKGGFPMTSILMIVMVVVLVIAAVAVFTGKKK